MKSILNVITEIHSNAGSDSQPRISTICRRNGLSTSATAAVQSYLVDNSIVLFDPVMRTKRHRAIYRWHHNKVTPNRIMASKIAATIR